MHGVVARKQKMNLAELIKADQQRRKEAAARRNADAEAARRAAQAKAQVPAVEVRAPCVTCDSAVAHGVRLTTTD